MNIFKKMKKKYFSPSLKFESHLFMIFYLEALFLSIISATTNTILKKGIPGVIFQWTFIVFMLVMLFVSSNIREKLQTPLLLFAAFIYVPFLSFQTAGFDGTATLFALIAMLMITIMVKNSQKYFIIILNILLWIGVTIIQYMFPETVTPHGDIQAKFLDFIVALTITLAAIAALGIYFQKNFEQENKKFKTLNEKLNESNHLLEELAIRDPLTGIYNRRYLDHLLKLEENIYNKGIYIAILDLDNFKDINDTYGHQTGDKILIQISEILTSNAREDDIVSRFGGEEFLMVIKSKTAEGALCVAERIREIISEYQFVNDIRLTISIGICNIRDGESGDEVITRADICLYDAKNNGKNQVRSEMY